MGDNSEGRRSDVSNETRRSHMSVTRWDPFQDLHAFREEMNRTLSFRG